MTSLQLVPAIYSAEVPAGKGFPYFLKYFTEQQITNRTEGAKGLGLVTMPPSQHHKNIQ